MASTTETGHAKNVATFGDLISFCTGYGEMYHPSNDALTLPALNTLLEAANAALQAVKVAKTGYDNATNAREVAFKPLKALATKIMNALAATEAAAQTVADARSTNLKIQGRRSKRIEKPTAAEVAAGAEPAKTASTSQQSFDKLIDHFVQLITTLSAEPKYQPNEEELKVATLTTQVADLREKNTAAITANTALSNARINRNNTLYGETNGIVEIALDVKNYVKSVFGAASPQYKQISGLQLYKPKRA